MNTIETLKKLRDVGDKHPPLGDIAAVNEYLVALGSETHFAQKALDDAIKMLEVHRELLIYAEKVMNKLEEHGASIVPHLLDTDDNDGQRLREAIEKAQPPENKD